MYTVIRENFVVKNFRFAPSDENFLHDFFTSNTIYGKYMVHIWHERKYCYTKISNKNVVNKINTYYIINEALLYKTLGALH